MELIENEEVDLIHSKNHFRSIFGIGRSDGTNLKILTLNDSCELNQSKGFNEMAVLHMYCRVYQVLQEFRGSRLT